MARRNYGANSVKAARAFAGVHKDVRALIRRVEKAGGSVTWTGHNHLEWTHPAAPTLVTGGTANTFVTTRKVESWAYRHGVLAR